MISLTICGSKSKKQFPFTVVGSGIISSNEIAEPD